MAETLDLLIVPTATRWLVYPKTIAKHVFPYAPSLSVENASEFVIGSILVNNMIIPIVDFDFDHRSSDKVDQEGLRIVMIETISNQSNFSTYALLSYGEPLSLLCQASMIEKVDMANHRYLAQEVLIKDERLENKGCFMPNLLSFESELKMR